MLVLALGVALFAASAQAAQAYKYGQKWLTYGSCCSGAKLQGTRAGISEGRMTVPNQGCVMFSSVATDTHASTGGGAYTVQLEAGLGKCGVGNGCGGELDCQATCVMAFNTHKFYETFNGSISGSYFCYDEGEANIGQQYEMTTQETSATSGVYEGRIDGNNPHDLSGFDNNMKIQEWGEQNGVPDCGTDWSVDGAFVVWQRWNYGTNSWFTIQNSESSQECSWILTPLYYVNPNDQYFYADANYP